MTPVDTAVIGVGHQGRWHADKFAALDEARLVAVADADEARCNAVAADLGVEAVTDYHDLIGRVAAVSIATPTPSHFDIATTLLDAGVHVLIEKPLASTIEQARQMVELAEARGVILQVGHLERFNPVVMAMAPHVSHPEFIESIRVAPFQPRGTDVSVVLDLMIHDIDLIHSFTRSRMSHLDAVGRAVFTDHLDIANARIEFESGCVANVTSSRISLKKERSLRIFQPHAYISADLLAKHSTMYRKRDDQEVISPEDLEIHRMEAGPSDALLHQARAFLDSVSGGAAPLVTGRVALQALETAINIAERIDLR